MEIPEAELFSILSEYNPWWSGQPIEDLPRWERSAARLVWEWVNNRQSNRSLLLTGARQTGKTTLYRQTIRRLVEEQYPPENILYATFDHTMLKLAGIERVMQAWESLYQPREDWPCLLFLDEIQYLPDWQVWLKHQVDFHRKHRIAVTGSASPLRSASVESGVGRWETIPLPTLSFGEFLKLGKRKVRALAKVSSLLHLFHWTKAGFARAAEAGRELTVHFHDYLLRGGFPEPALATDLTRCQRLLREDIIEKVLKRDMTALYGVRRILEFERLFSYLCLQDGGILDVTTISRHFEGVSKQTVSNFIDLLESTHLIDRLKPFGYGKEILRGRDKIYMADAAIPGAVLLLGRGLLERPEKLGAAVEAAFYKHLFTRYYKETPTFSYWRDRSKGHRELEVDIVAEIGERVVPFEVKYQGTAITPEKLLGLRRFLDKKKLDQGYVITRRWEDFGPLDIPSHRSSKPSARIMMVPAPLACYWLS